MQARRISRELALLSLSQLPNNPEKLAAQQLNEVVLAAVRTMTTEVHDVLETAAAELKRGSDRILTSQTRATDLNSSREMVEEAIDLTQNAINRVGIAIELPEFIYLANQKEVRAYTLEILTQVSVRRAEIDELISGALVDWQLSRLPRIERDLLRIAVAEIWSIGIPDRVAINEAIELAKRYSTDDAHRFINGVLRRVTESIAKQQSQNPSQHPNTNNV
ncbi:MAG: transcription antitermination factor NusB [Cyanobacteriota bacterium]|nr:transcription antitermination factor NusB [Cyanobacteriota bacterium]